MRSVTYWKNYEIVGECFSMQLVPPQTYSEPSYDFDAVLETIKQAGFSYRVTETTERILEGSTQGCGSFPNRERAGLCEMEQTD